MQEMRKEYEGEKEVLRKQNVPFYKYFKFGYENYFIDMQKLCGIPLNAKFEADMKLYGEIMKRGYETEANFVSTKKIDVGKYFGGDFKPTSEFF